MDEEPRMTAATAMVIMGLVYVGGAVVILIFGTLDVIQLYKGAVFVGALVAKMWGHLQ